MAIKLEKTHNTTGLSLLTILFTVYLHLNIIFIWLNRATGIGLTVPTYTSAGKHLGLISFRIVVVYKLLVVPLHLSPHYFDADIWACMSE